MVFAVTGINDKINKAAASVFGEDLVKVGSIFGAAYGAFGGGPSVNFGGTPIAGGVASAAEGLDAVNGLDSMSDAFSAANTGGAGGFGSLAGMAGENIDTLGSPASYSDGMTAAETAGIESMTPSRTLSPMASGGQDLLNGGGINGLETNGVAQPQDMVDAAPTQTYATSGQGAAGQGATAQVAAAPQQGAASTRAAGSVASGGATAPPTANRSFFDRLVYDEKGNVSKTALGAIGGVGKGIADASAASTLDKRKRQQYEREVAEQQRRTNQRTGLRVTG